MTEENGNYFLSRENLLKIPPKRVEVVDVPELGGKVRVQAMTALQRGRYEAAMVNSKGGPDKNRIAHARAIIIVETVVDEQGNKLLTPGDVKALDNQDGWAMDRIFEAAKRISGMDDEEAELDALEKN